MGEGWIAYPADSRHFVVIMCLVYLGEGVCWNGRKLMDEIKIDNRIPPMSAERRLMSFEAMFCILGLLWAMFKSHWAYVE